MLIMDSKVFRLKKLLKVAQLYDLYNHYLNTVKRRQRAVWSRLWLLRRDENKVGSCAFVNNELLYEDIDSYKNYLRMDNELFEKLHSLIEKRIKKQDTKLRQSISSRFRLIVTLRFLATGETYRSLLYSTRISESTISKFVPEVLNAIYDELKDPYLKFPTKSQEWLAIANEFYNMWNIPNTIGAMDGKHIMFRPPRSAGSHYYNYKGTHSIVLLAVADANYRFIYIDVGANGRVSDGGVFKQCDFALAINNNTLNLPDDKPLPGMNEAMPYVLVADSAFPLQEHIMKPFPFKNATQEEKVFNYRLSRARRVIENAFGILSNRFRILLTPINLSRDKVVLITQACCALHNFLKIEEPVVQMQEYDTELRNGQIEEGTMHAGISRQQLPNIKFKSKRPNNRSLNIREHFRVYFNGIGKVSWQDEMIK